VKTIRTKLLLQQQFLATLLQELRTKARGRGSPQTAALVKSLKLKSTSIRTEIRVTIENLPTVALLACPAGCGEVNCEFDFERAAQIIKKSRSFFTVVKKALLERDRISSKPRPCDAACIARVRARNERLRKELRYVRNLSRETITTIRNRPCADGCLGRANTGG